MLTDHIAGHHCQETGKFHELIIHAAIFPIKTVWGCHCPPPHKIGNRFEALPNFAGQNTIKKQPWNKHCHNRTGTKMGKNECRSFRIRSRTCNIWMCLHWFLKFNWLLEGCVIWRLANTSVFIAFQNLIDCIKAVLPGDWQTLDVISKGSDNGTKKKLNTKEEKCAPIVCCIIKYNVNIRWVDCTECTSWVHYLCESNPSDT